MFLSSQSQVIEGLQDRRDLASRIAPKVSLFALMGRNKKLLTDNKHVSSLFFEEQRKSMIQIIANARMQIIEDEEDSCKTNGEIDS